AGYFDCSDLIPARFYDSAELLYTSQIRARAQPCVKSAVNAHHVAALNRRGRLNELQPAKFRQGVGDPFRLRLPALCAPSCDARQFSQHNRRVFDEDRVGQVRLCGQAHETDAESLKTLFIALMLLDRFGDVDLLARKESQLAIGETWADGASDCCERSLLQFNFRCFRASLTATCRIMGFENYWG